MEDAWLMLRAGDQAAMLLLYDEHYIGLFNYGVKLTGSRERAAECITQVLIELWDKRGSLPEVENVRAYLLTCIRRKLMAEIKADRRRELRHHVFEASREQTEMAYEQLLISAQSDKALKQRLEKALTQLAPRQLELLRLRYFEDKGYDEIATICNITKRTAYNSIHDAIKILRTELQVEGDENSALYSIPLLVLLMLTMQ
ncbi:RNA polymerase sigma-70 factor (ECF subfamily) [Chitinophaga niastensis]|uniref:RNA polymerase sigma-70 factor (ECF subfamily) n=1 Tax=Chitinophaga niastensis TaxID=536980 RepID=A0A2P8HLV9_CHINA|nr:sigma-70 family RNA polymerase sigma factor [Chitinophaga niastensis]PSL47202.1 RNA polymerase sigma-70 factor (ECF subfamily) [Chitinophaga niastensis]